MVKNKVIIHNGVKIKYKLISKKKKGRFMKMKAVVRIGKKDIKIKRGIKTEKQNYQYDYFNLLQKMIKEINETVDSHKLRSAS